jgi:hypothetical protein
MRGNARINIALWDQIQLPFDFWFTTAEVGFQQPFNQFGVNPKIGNFLTLHGGYFFAKISDLCFGDTRMLGAGFELTPGNYRVSFLYGRLREQRSSDSVANFPGEYKRMAYAFKIGYGAESEMFAHLNIMRAWDDTTTKLTNSNSPYSKDNLVSSLSFGLPISSLINFTGEAAVSALTDDRAAPKLNTSDEPGFLKLLFTPNYSTQIDAAFKAALAINPYRFFSFRINTMWVGPGFQSLGFPQLPNDVFDITLAPLFRLFDGNLSLKGSIGVRQNNLRENHVSNTSRVIGSIDVYSQITQDISLNANYSNYGMKTSMNRDTIKIQNISQIFSLSPSFLFQWLGGMNNLNLTYSYQDVFDKSSYDTTSKKNQTHTSNIIHSILYESSLTLTTGLYYNSNKSDYSSNIFGITETVGYSFAEKKLTTSFTIGFTTVKTTKTDNQLNLRIVAGYSFDQYGTLTANLSNMNYMTGSGGSEFQSVPSYNEMQGSLQYSINF